MASHMILAVPEPQKVQFGPRPWVISAAKLFVHSCTPITEGAQSLMNLIKCGLRRLHRRLGNSSIAFSLRQLRVRTRAAVPNRFLITSSYEQLAAGTNMAPCADIDHRDTRILNSPSLHPIAASQNLVRHTSMDGGDTLIGIWR